MRPSRRLPAATYHSHWMHQKIRIFSIFLSFFKKFKFVKPGHLRLRRRLPALRHHSHRIRQKIRNIFIFLIFSDTFLIVHAVIYLYVVLFRYVLFVHAASRRKRNSRQFWWFLIFDSWISDFLTELGKS